MHAKRVDSWERSQLVIFGWFFNIWLNRDGINFLDRFLHNLIRRGAQSVHLTTRLRDLLLNVNHNCRGSFGFGGSFL